MAQARSVRAINGRGKKRGSVIYGKDRDDEVSEIFNLLYCVSDGFGNDSIGEERLKTESARRWSNKWTKTLYQDYLHCIANFCRALLIIFRLKTIYF